MEHQKHVGKVENVQQGTFDWRIERYMEINSKNESSLFKVGTRKCYLTIFRKHKDCKLCYNYSNVYLESSNYKSFNNKTVYKLSLIGVKKEFLLTKRTSLITYDNFIPLAIMDDDELDSNKNDLLPEDALTLRLSWYEEEDCSIHERDNCKKPYLAPAEKEFPKCLETLSGDFSHFYETKMDTDCVLRVGETEFCVHRQILAARSEVFAAMFHHDTSERRSGVVDIPDADGTVLSDVLNYIYSGQIRGLTPDTAVAMYTAADRYALKELKGICLEFLKCCLTVRNVCQAAVLAHTHGELNLEKRIILFIEDKLEELEESREWQNFLKNEWFLSAKLLSSALMSSKHKVKKLSLE